MLEGEEGEKTEGETITEGDIVDEPTPFDGLARDMGWFPKSEYKGDPEKWRPAEEYIKHGVQSTKALKRDLKEVKDTAARLARTSASITERALADQLRDLEARKDAAIDEGDRATVKQVDAQIKAIERQAESHSAEADFAAKNAWYGKDEEATAFAVSVSQRLASQGKTEEQQLEAAEEAVRKRFPELFDEPVTPRRSAPVVNAPASRSSTLTPKEKGVSDLPREAREAGEDYVRMINKRMPTAKYTLADYAKTYWSEAG